MRDSGKALCRKGLKAWLRLALSVRQGRGVHAEKGCMLRGLCDLIFPEKWIQNDDPNCLQNESGK